MTRIETDILGQDLRSLKLFWKNLEHKETEPRNHLLPRENFYLWGGRAGLPIIRGLYTFGRETPNLASSLGSHEVKLQNCEGRVLVLRPSHASCMLARCSNLSTRGKRRHSTRKINKTTTKTQPSCKEIKNQMCLGSTPCWSRPWENGSPSHARFGTRGSKPGPTIMPFLAS